MDVPRLPADADPDELASVLQQAGCVVVTHVLDAAGRHTLRSELAPLMANSQVIDDDDPTQFYPGRTRRASGLVGHSKAVGDLVLHDYSTRLCDRILSPNSEFGYQLHVTAALEVGPGARRQILHREHDSFTYFADPKPDIIVASMWAITDFRADNGATLVVPGSHTWAADRTPDEDEIVAAEMPAGSVLYWLGGTLHGAGASVASDWRYGIILTYSLGWVRQEENQYLSVPPEMAQHLSAELRAMIGYQMYGGLGFSTDRRVGALPDT